MEKSTSYRESKPNKGSSLTSSRKSHSGRQSASKYHETPRSQEKSAITDPNHQNFDFNSFEEQIGQEPNLSECKAFFSHVYSKFIKDTVSVLSTAVVNSSTEPLISPEYTSSLKILKAAPQVDRNNNEMCKQSNQEVFIEPKCQESKNSEKDDDIIAWKSFDCCQHSEPDRSSNNRQPQPQQKQFEQVPTPIPNKFEKKDSSKVHDETSHTVGDGDFSPTTTQNSSSELTIWLNKFTQAYSNELKKIYDCETLSPCYKLKEINLLLQSWIVDLNEQIRTLVKDFDEIEEAIVKDRAVNENQIKTLKNQLLVMNVENRQWNKSVKNIRSHSSYTQLKLQDELDRLIDANKRIETALGTRTEDLKVLLDFVILLRDGKKWDLKELKGKMSSELYTTVFGSNRESNGHCFNQMNELEQKKSKLREEIKCLKDRKEKARSDAFLRERNLERLKKDEEKTIESLMKAHEEEIRLRRVIEELKSEQWSLLDEGRCDTCQDFVKL